MKTVNIHAAKTQLSKLVDQASKGDTFVLARAGKPVAKLVPLSPDEVGGARRLGFLSGELAIPDEFDRMGG